MSDSVQPYGLQHRYRNTVVLCAAFWLVTLLKTLFLGNLKIYTPWDFLHMQSYYLSIGAIFFLSFPYPRGFFSFLIELTMTFSLILNVIRESRNSFLFSLGGKAVSLLPNMKLV